MTIETRQCHVHTNRAIDLSANFSGICYFADVEFLNLLSHNLPVARRLETGFFTESLGECEVLSKKTRFLTPGASRTIIAFAVY
ncbi:MAG: hypothetical protein MUE44_28100 [Oscillatoriaceae cyanobacterium Prado104]|nr:hypothetical protein [Oscillatoriaceae cyanobacterium Prado104]